MITACVLLPLLTEQLQFVVSEVGEVEESQPQQEESKDPTEQGWAPTEAESVCGEAPEGGAQVPPEHLWALPETGHLACVVLPVSAPSDGQHDVEAGDEGGGLTQPHQQEAADWGCQAWLGEEEVAAQVSQETEVEEGEARPASVQEEAEPGCEEGVDQGLRHVEQAGLLGGEGELEGEIVLQGGEVPGAGQAWGDLQEAAETHWGNQQGRQVTQLRSSFRLGRAPSRLQLRPVVFSSLTLPVEYDGCEEASERHAASNAEHDSSKAGSEVEDSPQWRPQHWPAPVQSLHPGGTRGAQPLRSLLLGSQRTSRLPCQKIDGAENSWVPDHAEDDEEESQSCEGLVILNPVHAAESHIKEGADPDTDQEHPPGPHSTDDLTQEEDEDDVGPEPGGDDETTERVTAPSVVTNHRTEVGRHHGVCEAGQKGLSEQT